MAEPTFIPRVTQLETLLLQTAPALATRYFELQRNSASLTEQNTQLQSQLVALRSRLSSIEQAEDTYNREFSDRPKPSPSIFSRSGLNTFQDWLLATFFGIYALVVIALTVFTALVSKKKAQGASIVLGSGVILGILIAAVIARFA